MIKNKNLAFMHIPKNAGTSFFYMLGTQYPPHERFDIKVINERSMNTAELAQLSRSQREKIKLVSGHFRYGIHRLLVGETDYVTFLRDPLTRIPSSYNFILSQPEHRLHQEVVGNKMSLYDFVTQMQVGDVNNAQVRMISGKRDTPEAMLEKALENIDQHFSLVLLTERFDESLILFKRRYQVKKLRYLYSNKTEHAKVADPHAQVDAATRDAIQELNAADIELYKQMSKKFDEQWQATPNKQLELFKLGWKNKVLAFRSKTGV